MDIKEQRDALYEALKDLIHEIEVSDIPGNIDYFNVQLASGKALLALAKAEGDTK